LPPAGMEGPRECPNWVPAAEGVAASEILTRPTPSSSTEPVFASAAWSSSPKPGGIVPAYRSPMPRWGLPPAGMEGPRECPNWVPAAEGEERPTMISSPSAAGTQFGHSRGPSIPAGGNPQRGMGLRLATGLFPLAWVTMTMLQMQTLALCCWKALVSSI
jgi:hypothetical protein